MSFIIPRRWDLNPYLLVRQTNARPIKLLLYEEKGFEPLFLDYESNELPLLHPFSESRIRTYDRFTPNRFTVCRLQPLGHLFLLF